MAVEAGRPLPAAKGHAATETSVLALIDQYQGEVYVALRTIPAERIVEALVALQDVDRRRGTVFVLCPPSDGENARRLAEELERGVKAGTFGFRLARVSGVARQIAAWQNDWAYEDIYAQQLMGLAGRGDLVIAISRQGQAPGLARALEVARRGGAESLAIVGHDGGLLKGSANLCLHIQSQQAEQVEDVELMLVHILSVGLRRLVRRPPQPAEATIQ